MTDPRADKIPVGNSMDASGKAADGPPDSPPVRPPEKPFGKPFWKRRRFLGAILILVVLLGLIVMNFTPLRTILAQTEILGAWFKAQGLSGMLLYIAGVTLLISIGIPRLLLCSIGGMAFGFWQGLLLTQAGTLIGFYAIFSLVRHAGWSFSFLRKRPNLNSIQKRIGKGGVMSVFGIRMMPLSGFYSTIMMGMLPIRHRAFLLGTILGIFPQAIPATLIGAGATQETLQTSIISIIAAVVAFILVWYLIDYYRKKVLKLREEEDSVIS
ncbi:Uncharacterized membrane protein YdjX, TVP38/TMEM64 family, SNARE-associated domain [Desulfonatronum thiosulfatophilum]|uniref:TVP38/TMEM64 family membrane protein n=1 Tax=Desulfonatronum thiosulfatophilum TaxID=617002 RepID=A0A1G6ESP1_9BACT|nr:VTT domain-containing protein [Desulfonatronum thiosulfatophilum]SDB60403.1 Uncharacterized membrane protein YdjX, TVP38/TMEM64 family, SNARE-associated domain [Desulfonatronum thiosulfatophilum]